MTPVANGCTVAAMKVLDLGAGEVPSIATGFASLVLREQGHASTRWAQGRDPIQELVGGEGLWTWLMESASVQSRDPFTIDRLQKGIYQSVVDGIPRYQWQEHGLNRDVLARRLGVYWVSLEMPGGGPLSELRAQAQGWMDRTPYSPTHLADTTAGLWLATKLLALNGHGLSPGHFRIDMSTALAKMIEPELLDSRPNLSEEDGPNTWHRGWYGPVLEGGLNAGVQWDTEDGPEREPVRTREWKLAHLNVAHGRLKI